VGPASLAATALSSGTPWTAGTPSAAGRRRVYRMKDIIYDVHMKYEIRDAINDIGDYAYCIV